MGNNAICRYLKRLLPVFLFLCLSSALFGGAAVQCVMVKTFAPENKEVKFWYRVPMDYKSDAAKKYRILVFFGGRNTTGEKESHSNAWVDWADRNDVFILAPGFKNDDYWEPQKWSGKALTDAIAQIKRQYNVCDDKLLFYGYSAGAQCSNLFPAWMPEKTRAYVSHASGVFHKPTPKLRDVPGLLTCGDADRQRFVINHRFIADYQKLGINVLWKSFPNRPHDIPQGSVYLAQAFLEYYHKLYAADLDPAATYEKPPEKICYVGDDQDGVLYRPDAPAAKNIPEEDKVYFTSEKLARAWEACAQME